MSEPARRLGGMEILAVLSKGGMGEVLLGRKVGAHGFEKLVAIKTILADLSLREDMRKMFLDEARIMARLDHPSIVQVHDFGEDDGVLYLAMEYVAGVPLTQLFAAGSEERPGSSAPTPAATEGGVQKTGDIPIAVSARIVAEVCRGLHAAHELRDLDGRLLQLVHRDISPHNLLITFEGRIKILDFGVALIRTREAPVTQVGRLKGKASYMAPEQITGGRVDRRADVYAAGVVLHELLSGQKLFQASLLARVDSGPPSPPSASRKDVPPSLDAIVMRALGWAPKDRFGDAREMATELENAVKDAPATLVSDYVERALSTNRALHEERIRALLSGTQRDRPARPPRAPPESRTLAEETLSSVRPVEEPQTETRKLHKRPLILGSGVALAALAALGVWLVPGAIDRDPVSAPRALVKTANVEAANAQHVEQQIEPIVKAEEPPRPIVAPPAKKRASPFKKHEDEKPAVQSSAVDAVEYGSITVGADPYGIVVIDGQDLGVSPLADQRVTAGEHQIVLLHPTTRAVLKSRKVIVPAGEKLTVKL